MTGLSQMPTDAEVRDRAARLYRFVRRLIELRHTPVRSYKQYEFVEPLDNLPPPPDCSFTLRQDFDEDVDTWLEVRRPKLESYPAPPDLLGDWIDPGQLSDPTLDCPQLLSGSSLDYRQEDDNEESATPFAPEVEPPPDVRQAWQSYVEDRWRPWAERVRPKHRAKVLYDDLFRMYQRQEHLGETYELVIAFGLLGWRLDRGELRRHLVTAELLLELDSRRQILALKPTANGVRLRLEEDMLDPGLRPGKNLSDQIVGRLEAAPSSFDVESLHSLLAEYCHALSSDADYDRSPAIPAAVTDSPVVTFSPCLILRRRGAEGVLGLVDAIIENIENGGEIPGPVVRQICVVEKGGSPLSEEPAPFLEEEDEVYFPLPANREQREIVLKLRRAEGLVVQGPPGTGKSQTIANLVCHLLATGKRVLVTSHTARALQVLRDKIPEEIRPLCVQALSNDARGLEALEFSVKGITDRYNTWNPADVQRRIAGLEQDLAKARERLQEAINRQRDIREAETRRHHAVADSYSGTLAEIARRLDHERADLGIIADDLEKDSVPPIEVEEFRELLSVLRDGGWESEISCEDLPDISCLLVPDRFEELVDDIDGRQAEAEKALRDADPDATRRISSLATEVRTELGNSLDRLYERLRGFRLRVTEKWVQYAFEEILSGRDKVWRGRFDDTTDLLRRLNEIPKDALDARVAGHEGRSLDDLVGCARIACEFYASNPSRWRRISWLLPRNVRNAQFVLKSIRVNGEPCCAVTEMKLLIEWAEAGQTLDRLDQEWNFAGFGAERSIRRRIERYEQARECLEQMLVLCDDVRQWAVRLEEQCGDVGPVWHDDSSVRGYLQVFVGVNAQSVLEERHRELDCLTKAIDDALCRWPDAAHLERLGSSVRQKDARGYRAAYHAAKEEVERSKKKARAAGAHERLRGAVPLMAADLLRDAADRRWDSLADRWESAWRWAAIRSWVTGLCQPEAGRSVDRKIKEEQDRIRSLLAQLAADRAWSHCLGRLTESHRRSLEGWANAVRRIGKGKGRHAGQHRKAAREHLAGCQPAIPAWIMPFYRVAESTRPEGQRFDIAIVDEASQSGMEALALLFLADRVVVVGDDKQISPTPFEQVDEVNRLRRDYVADLPNSDALDPENSLFNLAKISYPDSVRLVEHFRCMPEIIRFCNDLCYKNEPLIPLRQFGAGRLEPVINPVHVNKGFCRGQRNKTNPAEAEAIARKVEHLVRDARYEGKSFGVISLLGEAQARLIEDKLRALVDPKELQQRRLICGDAYDFQGDERDIMLLSLVVAPELERHISRLSDPKGRDTRRYNVAVSRARDQLWLFHSVALEDLHPEDLRARLLQCCQRPERNSTDPGGINLDGLRQRARDASRSAELQPAPFDSWFEVDVFLKVADAGYRVIPQFEVNNYRIDLVVVGQKGKLAVECDGEYWHGPDRWEEDAARQRDLERCGWPFFRIRESIFYLEQEAAMQQLWEELSRQGIKRIDEETQPEEPPHPETHDASFRESSGFPDDEPEQSEREYYADPHQDQDLPPYDEWQPGRSLPKPGDVSPDLIIRALLEIVETEGPATWRRIFDRYRVGLRLGRLKGTTRKALQDAALLADRKGLVQVWIETDSHNLEDYVVHLPDSDRVRVRQRGPRDLQDIPCSEIAELMKMRDPTGVDEEQHFREVLHLYGLRRLTKQAEEHLRTAAEMARKSLRPN